MRHIRPMESGVIVRYASVLLALGLLATCAGASEFVETLEDFEGEKAQLRFVRSRDRNRKVTVSTERASEGKRSLKMTFVAGRPVLLASSYSALPFDWAPFDAFKMDLFNSTSKLVTLEVKVKSC